jgi:uncharacterized protein YciI
VKLEPHTLVLLRRGPRAGEFGDDELAELQAQHLAFLAAMRERGALAVAGPFRDQDDETLRGLCLYRTGLEETRALVAADPSVQRGRMAADVLTWLVPEGELPQLRDAPHGERHR